MSCVTIFLLLVPSAVLSATFLAIASFGIALETSDSLYSDVLLVLLFVEAIVMAVYLANPDKLDAPFLGTIAKLLEEYKGKNEDNSTANVVWNAIMEREVTCSLKRLDRCCGMNGNDEIIGRAISLPEECNGRNPTGCRDKLVTCSEGYSKHLLCASIAALLLQSTVIPLPITYAFLSFLDEVND
ncbi:conserved hypothetical protein [Echinococcus multilocularis]|uniref:Tetraspanin n=1 Tax=Echinococcus multilocularis TaxID=6211 RepID=A0A068Y280_ECHMU|nr:conserved hypothetical protein [Echinococcus multilocularis]